MNENIKCWEMLDILPFEVYAVDVQTDEIVYSNDRFKNSRTHDHNNICHKAVNGLNIRCPFCKRLEILDENGEPNGRVLSYEQFNEFTDSWYQIQEQAAKLDDGRVVRYVISIDITTQKEMQNRLAEAHAQLAIKNRELEENQIQQAKQAQLGELLDMIAHQWKQPISAIAILFGELKVGLDTDTLDSESIRIISGEGKKSSAKWARR